MLNVIFISSFYGQLKFCIITYMNLYPYDSIISNAMDALIPSDYLYVNSLLLIPEKGEKWILDLPNTVDVSTVVLHAQDYLHISPNGDSEELDEIERFQSTHGIKNLILLHWNHRLSEIYNGTLRLIEFPSHSHDLVQGLIKSKNEWSDVNIRHHELNYMCLNGIPKPHRKDTYKYLRTLGIPSVITPLQSTPLHVFPTYTNYDYDNIKNYISLLDVYKSAPINVITESLYDEPIGIITEKTLFAMSSMQLPILIAHKGAVADVESYGFDVFHDIIDHSYDTMPNESRWKSAIDLNIHVLNGELDYDSLVDRLKKNQEHLINNYLGYIETKLVKQLTDIVNS